MTYKMLSLVLAGCLIIPTLHANPRKFNPGHYIAVGSNDVDLDGIEGLQSDAVRGVNKRYTWRSLEPQKDQYDFWSSYPNWAA